jgi:hypothetical protein
MHVNGTERRTFKDVITFIPFVIILLIPLTPIGHVLVFGAIQRFFPDFFPSCFTEQRQNLLQLYENAEYSEYTINETLNVRFFIITLYHMFWNFGSSDTVLWFLSLLIPTPQNTNCRKNYQDYHHPSFT